MTQSQNTKSEQQKDLCITSEQLTEQWKKGELPNGYYWIRLSWGGMVIMAYHTAFDGLFELDDYYYDSDEISEVLAPVPSYEEWQVSYKCMLENEVLRLKNAQLKELRKECREILDYAKDFAYHDPCCKCIAKIDYANRRKEVIKVGKIYTYKNEP